MLKRELAPFIELLAAVLLSFILVLGTIHNIIKPFYDYRGRSFLKRFKSTLIWYFDFIAQAFLVVAYLLIQLGEFLKIFFSFKFWRAIKFIVHQVAYSIDLLGNVMAGELIEDFVTPMEKTFFGLGEIPISAAIGYCEWTALNGRPAALNKFGWFLSKALNVAFNEPEHCLRSYRESILNHPLYGKKDFLNRTI